MPIPHRKFALSRNKSVALPVVLLLLSTGLSSCRRNSIDPNVPMSITLTSEAFRNNEDIPQQFTCKGANLSPELSWQSLPPTTKSLALTLIDTHSVFGGYVHWVLYNLPPQPNSLPASLPADESLPNGAKQGINGDGKLGYVGPCPSSKSPHRYVFTLYALDTELTPSTPVNNKELINTMKGHILAAGELMGQFHN
jgi:Raf kinase inhibitor-like YbhB/YbcL family protein